MSIKKRIPWNKGIKYTPEQKVRLDTSGLGKNIDFKKRGKAIGKTRLGMKFSEKHKENLSKKLLKNWENPKYREAMLKAREDFFEGGGEVWNKGKEMPSHLKGENHPAWKGGVTPETQKIRNSVKYKIWRTAIFNRDDYTCMGCGKRGVLLEAHHIKSFAEHKNLRYTVNNGITYCVECHCKNDPGRMRTVSKKLKKGWIHQ